ncbi:MAG: hypothetical protein ISS36_01505 [Candidatus Aenigmarchaeota archaeon]|nr:hypothetical protein [Candidatus Aenigmarchaeota archaeon]
MADNLVISIMLTAAALVFITIAIIFAVTYIPDVISAGCWMSAQQQTKQFVGWYVEGPGKGVFTKEIKDLHRELNLGDCVEKTIFTNSPEVMCNDVNIVAKCPADKKGYIITCRDSSTGKVEQFFRGAQNICVGFSKPIDKELELEGKKKWCVSIDLIERKYKISAEVGECIREKD